MLHNIQLRHVLYCMYCILEKSLVYSALFSVIWIHWYCRTDFWWCFVMVMMMSIIIIIIIARLEHSVLVGRDEMKSYICPLMTLLIFLFHCHSTLCSPLPLFLSLSDRESQPESCLRYQRDPRLKKPMVPQPCLMLECSSTNKPLPTCSFRSKQPLFRQVGQPRSWSLSDKPSCECAHVKKLYTEHTWYKLLRGFCTLQYCTQIILGKIWQHSGSFFH